MTLESLCIQAIWITWVLLAGIALLLEWRERRRR